MIVPVSNSYKYRLGDFQCQRALLAVFEYVHGVFDREGGREQQLVVVRFLGMIRGPWRILLVPRFLGPRKGRGEERDGGAGLRSSQVAEVVVSVRVSLRLRVRMGRVSDLFGRIERRG